MSGVDANNSSALRYAQERIAGKNFILRIDETTMRAVEQWAADEFRSVNGQLQWIINDALRRSRRLPKRSTKAKPDDETEQSAE